MKISGAAPRGHRVFLPSSALDWRLRPEIRRPRPCVSKGPEPSRSPDIATTRMTRRLVHPETTTHLEHCLVFSTFDSSESRHTKEKRPSGQAEFRASTDDRGIRRI
jgi:hypothetical protein